MTMQKGLHLRYDVDKEKEKKKKGRRGVASIEDSVDTSIQRLADDI